MNKKKIKKIKISLDVEKLKLLITFICCTAGVIFIGMVFYEFLIPAIISMLNALLVLVDMWKSTDDIHIRFFGGLIWLYIGIRIWVLIVEFLIKLVLICGKGFGKVINQIKEKEQ